uniref:Uncharacterized protein n=1 Tax=Aegilops tauschii subsp. strangulata TaxID=200361 RepID=A0A453KU01_AEGTS
MARAVAAEAFSRCLGAAVCGLSGAWYNRHMPAAICARLPLVDLVLEVCDARVRSPPPRRHRHRPSCSPLHLLDETGFD